MRKTEREAKTAAWLQHLQAWRGSGQSLAQYAGAHQLNIWEAYRWRRFLRRRGLWPDERKSAAALPASAVQFARVRVKGGAGSPVPIVTRRRSMVVRMMFGNGRCAELEVADAAQLEEVVGVLERMR